MHQVGIIFISLLSILLLPFSNGQAESKDRDTRTILISFDGAQPEVIERLIRNGKLPWNGGFAKLIREGTKAEGMTSVLPTVTATNHISIATGAYPERTNIPANTLHNTDTSLTATTSGFSAPIDAETLWEAAKRQGKKVVTTLLPAPMAAEKTGVAIKLWGSACAWDSQSSSSWTVRTSMPNPQIHGTWEA
jgi:hypothetical protein